MGEYLNSNPLQAPVSFVLNWSRNAEQHRCDTVVAAVAIAFLPLYGN
jgi:hypothetical protein